MTASSPPRAPRRLSWAIAGRVAGKALQGLTLVLLVALVAWPERHVRLGVVYPELRWGLLRRYPPGYEPPRPSPGPGLISCGQFAAFLDQVPQLPFFLSPCDEPAELLRRAHVPPELIYVVWTSPPSASTLDRVHRDPPNPSTCDELVSVEIRARDASLSLLPDLLGM